MFTIWAKLNDKIFPIYHQFFIHSNCHFDRVYLSAHSWLYTRSFSLHSLQEFTGLVLPSSMRQRHKKRKRKQNPTALRAFFLSSTQETISLQLKNSFRFNLRISVLKFWKKNIYVFTARKVKRQNIGFNSRRSKISCSVTSDKRVFMSLFSHRLSNNFVTPPIFEALKPATEAYSLLILYDALKKKKQNQKASPMCSDSDTS